MGKFWLSNVARHGRDGRLLGVGAGGCACPKCALVREGVEAVVLCAGSRRKSRELVAAPKGAVPHNRVEVRCLSPGSPLIMSSPKVDAPGSVEKLQNFFHGK